MVDIVAPEVHPGMDALAREDVAHDGRRAAPLVLPTALADAEHDLLLVVEGDVRMVLWQVREEVDGRVLVERPVLPAVEEELRIVDAREGHHAPKEIRAAEEDDGRVQAAEAAADGNRQAARAILRADERQDFLDEVIVVILLTRGAPALVAPDVRPGLTVHRVDGEELDLARLDLRRHRVDHAEVLEVVAHRILRRQDEKRRARVAVDADVHLALQAVAVPGSIFSLHKYHVLFSFHIYSFLV